MDIYFTTRRNRTHFNLNPNVLVYLGPSLDEAISSVGTLVDYEQTPPLHHQEFYSAIPQSINREFVAYYENESFWFSIVKVHFEDQTKHFHRAHAFVNSVVCDCGFTKTSVTGSEAYRTAYLHVTNNSPGVIVDRRGCVNACVELNTFEIKKAKDHHETCPNRNKAGLLNEIHID